MSIWDTILLGLVQGLTEFLPISSSGHLVILQGQLGIEEPKLTLDIMLHLGTLAAILIHYRAEVWQLLKALLSYFAPNLVRGEESMRKLVLLIIISTAPTMIIGYTIAEKMEWAYGSPIFAALMLLVTGTVLKLTDSKWVNDRQAEGTDGITRSKSLIVGAVQGVSVLPGISRSGTTISAGLFLGLSREEAVRYSLLVSIPAVMGAQIWSLNGNITFSSQELPIYGAGALIALVVGYVALKILIRITLSGRLHLFSYYCWGLGALVLVSALLGR